jgi:hypothetical protein
MAANVLTVLEGRYRRSLTIVGRFFGEIEADVDDAESQEEAMYLGGSRDTISQGHQADGTYRVRDSMRIEIDHDAIPAGWEWVLHVEGRVESGVSMTPRLYNVTDAVATDGTAITATSEARQTITVPSNTGRKTYEGRIVLTGASAKDAWITMQAIRELE